MDDCMKAAPLIAVAAAMPLDADDHAFVESHLARCSRCTGALAASLEDDLEYAPPIWSTAMPQPSLATPRFVRPALLVAALAAAVLLTVILVRRNDSPPTVARVVPSVPAVASSSSWCPPHLAPKQTEIARWCEDAGGRKQGAYDIIIEGERQQHREYRDGRPHGTWTMFRDSSDHYVAEFDDGKLVSVSHPDAKVKPELAAAAGQRMEQLFVIQERELARADLERRVGLGPGVLELEREGERGRRRMAAIRSMLEPFVRSCTRFARTAVTVELRLTVKVDGRLAKATASVDDKHRLLGTCLEKAVWAARFPPRGHEYTVSFPLRFTSGS